MKERKKIKRKTTNDVLNIVKEIFSDKIFLLQLVLLFQIWIKNLGQMKKAIYYWKYCSTLFVYLNFDFMANSLGKIIEKKFCLRPNCFTTIRIYNACLKKCPLWLPLDLITENIVPNVTHNIIYFSK